MYDVKRCAIMPKLFNMSSHTMILGVDFFVANVNNVVPGLGTEQTKHFTQQ